MSFDLFAMQTQVLAQLAPVANGIVIEDMFGAVDLTDNGPTIGAQTVFLEFSPVDQVARSALHNVRWSFDVFIDSSRASVAEKTAAAALFSAALGRLVGWEISSGREVRTAPGQESGFVGRFLRISFGFIVPVIVAG